MIRGSFEAVVAPRRFAQRHTDEYAADWTWTATERDRLVVVYVVNPSLYAVPLTLDSTGVQNSAVAPAGFAPLVGGVADTEPDEDPRRPVSEADDGPTENSK